ncbi:uncharacterized protein LOC120274651 [Dioscorea cayenensis subsp. rotundata]|uniref:Uncharacterized protein LOC120274651 n=1 Tax=Dioscorea cayennensis subsp. rotundata TaxID=55577 RepID=A0AB40CB44_DIOCR|nr:uncharacterized protein LOC120274651 [Dioscorea cayenensis subsp. rotundata]
MDVAPIKQPSAKKPSSRFGELAGATTARCAAVCCCCPCGILDLVVLAMVRLPAGLCRHAFLKGIRRVAKRNKGTTTELLLPIPKGRIEEGCLSPDDRKMVISRLPYEEEAQLERQMWDQFYSTGFWRSSSQK